MDGLDFGVPDLTTSIPSFTAPSFNLPEFRPELGNLAGMSGLTNFNPNIGGLNFGSTDFPAFKGDAFTGVGPSDAGGKSTFQNISDYAKTAAPILGVGTSLAQIPLSLAALSQAGRGTKALEGAVATESRAAAPGIAASEKLLPAGTEALLTGILPPELQASVDNQVNQARQALLQQLVSQGIDPQTAQAMIETQMQELKTNLTMQAAQALLSGGGATGTQAIEAAALGGKLASGETGTATTALSEAQRALLRLTGSAA